MTLRTNEAQLVEMAVMGNVSQPSRRYPGYTLDTHGVGRVLPGMSGVVYNARVGDPAFGWSGDHVEPGITLIMTSASGGINPVVSPSVNLRDVFPLTN